MGGLGAASLHTGVHGNERAATLTPPLAADNLTHTRYVDPLSRYRPFGVPAPGRSMRLALRAAF